MTGCIFCKISSGAVPAKKIYEDESVVAFLDANPCCKGHTLLIPKKHFEDLFKMTSDESLLFFKAIKTVMEKIDYNLKPNGYNVGWNQGKSAGQAVPHFHLHIMPRWYDDGGGSMHSIINNQGGGATLDDIYNILKDE